MKTTTLFLFFALLATFCTAGTTDPSIPDQKYLDYAEGFKCVVEIKGKCECGQNHEYRASAVTISPTWVVTAAHVVKDAHNPVIVVSGKEFPVKRVIVHEDFKHEKVGYADIALCMCEGDFGLDFYPKLYESKDEVSKVVSMGGYGMSGTFSTGTVRSDRARRAGSNRVVRLERDVMVCNLADGRTAMEILIASGDSGGGLFIGNMLAGIHSFVIADDGKTDSDYGDESAHTRISKFAPWIRLKMEEK